MVPGRARLRLAPGMDQRDTVLFPGGRIIAGGRAEPPAMDRHSVLLWPTGTERNDFYVAMVVRRVICR